MRPVSSANSVSPSSRPLDGSARPPVVRTEQCRTASEYGGIDEWPTVNTRPDRAESRRCSCSDAPPCVNNNPFLMSSRMWQHRSQHIRPNDHVRSRRQTADDNGGTPFAAPKTTPSSASTPILQCQFHSRCVTSVAVT